MPQKIIFERKNILIAGGAGFIGSNLCDELIKNSNVICLDNFLTSDEKNIDHLLSETNFEFIKHDITKPIVLEDFPELEKFKIEFQGIQEIYNLACPMSPKYFNKNKIDTLLANSYGVKNILDLTLKYKAKLLHFSSSVVYGPNRGDNSKITENDIGQVNFLSDRSCYDEGKRFAETMVANFRDYYKLDAKIIRPFRIFGPRMKLADDQMISDFVDYALENKDLEIFGDKNFASSFCYISDCIDAAIKMMESDLAGPINIGSDILINLEDLAKKIIIMTSSKSDIIYKDNILFMTPLCLPDISKARNELGWMPIIGLDKGLENTIYELRASKGLVDVPNNI
jgi:nucleoside-diphosphate-sugar epimerase